MREDTHKHENKRERHHGHDHGRGHGMHNFGFGFHQGRGRWGGGGGRGPGRGGPDWFGAEGWNWGGPSFGGFGPFSTGRERLERGLLRHVILSVLKDGSMHGYEIIKQLEEKTHGHYAPSPGTLYPTLQYLAEAGFISSEQEGEKRIYSLTDEGRAELDKQHNIVEGFWSRFRERVPNNAVRHELRFAGDAVKDLMRTVFGGFRSGAFSTDPEAVRKVRQALERCQTEIREIIAASPAGQESAETSGKEETSEEYV